MTFQIHPLSVEPFRPLFELSDADLATLGACRVRADASPGYPCRVTLEDAEVGEELILANHFHLDANSPYRASHAVYVRTGGTAIPPEPGVVPDMLARRTLAVRGFDAAGMLCGAEIVEGADLADALRTALSDTAVACAHIHFAAPGCYAARATRVE